jgi:hypothetical protein
MLRGYIKKTKPATWTTVPGAVTTQSAKEGNRAAVAFLKRKFPVKRQKPVRKVSKKLAPLKARYRARVKVWLEMPEHAWCVCCIARGRPTRPATECHHKFGRRGRLLLWEPGWRAVCSGCHEWIHRINPVGAQEIGMLATAGAWENFERAVIREAHK